jgi:hypothetical protein
VNDLQTQGHHGPGGYPVHRGPSIRALVLDAADFSLGGSTMTKQRIIVLDSDIYKGFPANGIVGYSNFGHYITELDYDNHTMTLYHEKVKPDDSWAVIPLY